jgi:hypothetical protein
LPKSWSQGAFERLYHDICNLGRRRSLTAGFYHGIHGVLKPREKSFNAAIGMISNPAV